MLHALWLPEITIRQGQVQSKPQSKVVEGAMQNALETNPQQIQNLRKEAITRAQQMLAGATPQFNWGRLAIALGLLGVALFGGGLYSSVHHLNELGKSFYSLF
jgi:hypothetical protein